MHNITGSSFAFTFGKTRSQTFEAGALISMVFFYKKLCHLSIIANHQEQQPGFASNDIASVTHGLRILLPSCYSSKKFVLMCCNKSDL